MEFRILKQETIYKGRILTLIVDTIEQATGHQTIREIVRHPGGVLAVARLDDQRILFVRQLRYPISKMMLELPAGKRDHGEPPETCVLRELEEETGYRAGKIQKLCEFYTAAAYCDELLHLYLATDLVPTQQNLEPGEEFITVEAYSLDEALALMAKGEITDAKTIIGLLWLKAHQ
jgi:ADP-ribose pyrophosphatase